MADVSVSEGSVAVVTITRSGDTSQAQTVDVSTVVPQVGVDTAEANDFTTLQTTTVTFAAGQQTATVEISTVSDEVFEGAETFRVELSNPTNGAVVSEDAFGVVTILDDGSGPDPDPENPENGPDDDRPTLTIGDVVAEEGSNAVFAVTVDKASEAAFDVRFVAAVLAGNTAEAADFDAANLVVSYGSDPEQVITANEDGTFTVPAGVTTLYVSVPTLDDDDVEGDETFTLSASVEDDNYTDTDTGTGTIVDDDEEAGDNSDDASEEEAGDNSNDASEEEAGDNSDDASEEEAGDNSDDASEEEADDNSDDASEEEAGDNSDDASEEEVGYQDQFDLGQRSLLDLLDSQNEYFDTERAFLSAEAALRAAQTRTLANMGLLRAAMDVDGLNAEQIAEYNLELTRGDDPNGQALCPLEAPAAVEIDKEALLARLASASASGGQDASRYRSIGDNRVAVSLNVQFAVNSSIITSAYDEEIGKAAAFLQANPDVVAVVEGHTDISGTQPYNQGLSERRADAVRSLLVDKQGVRETQITAVGYGQTRPLADNATAEGRALNRRVDLVLDSSGS